MDKETRKKKQEEIIKRKQENRDYAKRVKRANKCLKVAPKKTQRSLSMIHLDKEGVFHFDDGRWVKVFAIEDGAENIPKALEGIESRIRFTHFHKESDQQYLTLTAAGDIYEDVRVAFQKDQEVIEDQMKVKALDAQELGEAIRVMSGMEQPFSFEHFMKKRRDLMAEILRPVTEEYESFQRGKEPGISFYILSYPDRIQGSVTGELAKASDEMILTFTLQNPLQKEREAFAAYLLERYGGAYKNEVIDEYICGICKITLLWKDKGDMDKRRKAVEKIFAGKGYVIVPNFGMQKTSMEDAYLLGLAETGTFQNVKKNIINDFFIKEHNHDSD